MMHQDSLEPAAIRFTLKRLQESFSPCFFHVFISTGTLESDLLLCLICQKLLEVQPYKVATTKRFNLCCNF